MTDFNLDDLVDEFEQDRIGNPPTNTDEPDNDDNPAPVPIDDNDDNGDPIPDPVVDKTDEDTDTDDDKGIDEERLKAYYNFLDQYGLVVPPEENFEFDGKIETFEKVLETTQKAIANNAYSNIWNALPEDFKPLLEYGLAGGNSLQEYLEAYKPLDLDNVDLDDPNQGRSIMFEYYKQTSPHSDERINKFIDNLQKDPETFEQSVMEAIDELKELKEQKKQELVANVEAEKQRQREKAQQQTKLLADTINSSTEFENIRKDRIKTFMLNPIKVEGRETTEFNDALAKIFSNPAHLVQLADVVADYHPLTGFTFNRIKKQLKTDTTKSVKSLLSTALESSKRKGTSAAADDANFNWNNVL